jgi:hypothetical protein
MAFCNVSTKKRYSRSKQMLKEKHGLANWNCFVAYYYYL